MLTREQYLAGTKFDDEIDPDDEHFRIITLRVPRDPGSTYTGQSKVGEAAHRAQIRMALGWLAGAGIVDEESAFRLFQLYKDPD